MRVDPDGPVPAELALFGEAPGFEEQQEGRGFVGKSGQHLWAMMRRFTGLNRHDFYVSNLIKDGLPKNRDPKPHEISAALPEFLDELERVRPRIVVTAGAFATRALLGDVPMANVHGIPHEANVGGQEFIVHPIYHPAAGLHNKGFLAAFAFDLGRLDSLLRGDLRPWAPSGLDARTSWLSRDAVRLCESLEAPVVALDTEGWVDLPRMVNFSPDGKHGFVIRTDDAAGLDWFRRWLKKRVVAMHGGIYDLPILRVLNVQFAEYHDTQVLGYHDILRTGSGVLEAESQNLGTLAYRESNLILGELSDCPGVDLASRVIPYNDQTMHYAGMDPIATYRLFGVYADRGLLEYQPYQIDMGQIALVQQMVENGLPVDTDATLDYYADVLGKIEDTTTELRQMAARFGNRDFNPGSHPQVREIITRKIGLRIRKRTKGGQASTNEKALADHKANPFVKRLQDYRELDKLRGTYLRPLLAEVS